MIELITRIRYPELYTRMKESAEATALGPLKFSAAFDDGSPKLAESYNLLGAVAKGDILLFVHDDIVFISQGWDERLRDALRLGFNVAGVVGSQRYDGGMIFDAGRQYSAGRVVGIQDGKRVVKLMHHRAEVEPVKVVDGMLMAVDAAYFRRSGGFDWQFDGLFYYDLDFCLRSHCAVADILVSHEKPSHLHGQYPAGMLPREHYASIFNAKHGFKAEPPIGEQSCSAVLYEDYVRETAAA